MGLFHGLRECSYQAARVSDVLESYLGREELQVGHGLLDNIVAGSSP
jgi:hypothetical protein